jgi:hypothetical protein
MTKLHYLIELCCVILFLQKSIPLPPGAVLALVSERASVWKLTMNGAVQSGKDQVFRLKKKAD